MLEGDDHLVEAVKCFQRMQNELPDESSDERARWELGKGRQKSRGRLTRRSPEF